MLRPIYPFTAVVGQEKAKTALILSAIDPRLGGVLITGPKGSGKSTIVRAMEDILPKIEYVEGCPYNCNPGEVSHLCSSCRERLAREGHLAVGHRRMRILELPAGATEDGLLGTIDAEVAFQKGVKVLRSGLLGRANQNILYIDQINLLPDHLIDCILDPAVSGWNVVQRESLSLAHPSRFTLIASMNPEEGGLRPQILDRFALKVEMDQLMDPEQRVEVVRRNLSFEEDPSAFCEAYEEEQARLRRRIQATREALASIKIPETVMRGIAEVCSRLGVEGLRSDIAILKAVRSLAAFEGRETVGPEDIMRVFDLAVIHRFKGERRKPLERTSFKESLKDILFKEISLEAVEEDLEPSLLKADLSQELISPSTQFRRERRKRRRIPRPLNYIIFIATVAGLLISLSIISSMFTLLLQAMFFGIPIEVIIKGLTLRRVLLHLCVIAPIFMFLSLLSRRMRRPVLYFYTYLGSELQRRIVPKQTTSVSAEKDVEERIIIEDSGIINIPLYASLRRLYKMVIGKGAKLMEVGRRGKRSRYKFLIERRADRRLRSVIGKRSKTKARAERGRYVSYEFPKRRPWDVALGPTIRAAAPYQRSRDQGGLALKVEVDDIRAKVREMRAPLTIVLLLDMSESMIPSLVNVRNSILSMRDVALKKRDRLGLVIFKGEGASTIQGPTTNLNLVVKRLMEVGASDFTPLASGMYQAWRVLRNEKVKNKDVNAVLVIISDGIANIPLEAPLTPYTRSRFLNDAQADSVDAAQLLRREGIMTLVINPSHVSVGAVAPKRYKEDVKARLGKLWLEPTELLMEIPKITGGYYYGIGEEGELEEVILTEAFGVLGR